MKAFAKGVSLICHLYGWVFGLWSLVFAPEELHVYSSQLAPKFLAPQERHRAPNGAPWFPDVGAYKHGAPPEQEQRPKITVHMLHTLVGLRGLLCSFLRFQLRELLFGLNIAGLIAERCQPGIE